MGIESEGKAARSIQEHSLEIQNIILPIDRSIDQSINQDSEFRGKDVELDEELASPPGLHVTPKRQGVIASREECAEGLEEILPEQRKRIRAMGDPSQDDLYALDGTDWQSGYDGKRHSEAREGVFGLKTEYASAFPRQ